MRSYKEMKQQYFNNGYNTVIKIDKVGNDNQIIAIWNGLTSIINIFEIVTAGDDYAYHQVETIDLSIEPSDDDNEYTQFYSTSYVLEKLRSNGYQLVLDED
jgi:hypothetical protein